MKNYDFNEWSVMINTAQAARNTKKMAKELELTRQSIERQEGQQQRVGTAYRTLEELQANNKPMEWKAEYTVVIVFLLFSVLLLIITSVKVVLGVSLAVVGAYLVGYIIGRKKGRDAAIETASQSPPPSEPSPAFSPDRTAFEGSKTREDSLNSEIGDGLLHSSLELAMFKSRNT